MSMAYLVDEKTGCWIWSGPTCAKGRYGLFDGKTGGALVMAHRRSYEIHKGNIGEGLCVCHKCDNGLCINPEHLFIGTKSENMKDAFEKGRLPLFKNNNQSGENNRNAKYNKEFADRVREFYRDHRPSFSKLAKEFGLKSKGHAYNIVKFVIWN